MPIYKWDNQPYTGPHVLDNPPPFHAKLCDYGARPYWSPDGKRIAFVNKAYGDVHEIDLETREIRDLTGNLGDHHSFLRVLFLPNGDYLLIGPKEFKHHFQSRYNESELWHMDREAKTPPRPLGLTIFEGIGVSTIANRITYSRHGGHDPSIGTPEHYECYVSELEGGPDGVRIGETRPIYRGSPGRRPEPQDFRHGDTEVIMADYVGPRDRTSEWKTVTRGIDLATLDVRTYIDEPWTHNECEGIFPDGEHICLESSCDLVNQFPPIDLWKLKLDGSGRRVRMTRMIDHPPWRASNSNVSPDSKWLAFMVNTYTSEPGFGMGLGLLDLEAWEKSEYASQWETPEERAALRLKAGE
jgi:hypothetical protein